MSRNDAILNTGMSSPARREAVKKQTEEKKPDPKAEIVLTEIAKMKEAVMSVQSLVLDDTRSDEAKLKELERMRDRFEFLASLEKRMQLLLGVKV